ncbi:MAG: TonB-dependent receptor, partial [Flavisolibacter sp.]|nr:TonB-dependent receptor [Flavisolibacter sp.]
MMRYFLPGLVLYIMAFFLMPSAFGQEEKRISGNFTNSTFPQFVQKMEAVSDFHFYYTSTELDSFQVNVSAQNILLKDLLKKIFEGTDFYFAIDHLNHVFISKKVPVLTNLPAGFFEKQSTIADSAAENYTALVQDQTNKKETKATLENKLFEIGTKTSARTKATIAGYVKDAKNGEALAGATVFVEGTPTGIITDQFGYYALSLPPGRYTLQVSGAGMKETKRRILLHSDGKLNIELEDYVPSLTNVVVVAERKTNILSTQMGVNRLNIKTIKQIPSILGETDILRVVLALPGVTSVGEASTGFNVRGGSSDQNLILFNDATVYNPSHLFGFFSAFNADVVKGVELYKSAIPEKYGGRLSSVLDVTTREGNSKKVSGIGGIGLLTSKLTVEGPLTKEKTTFLASGRTTYSNWLLKQLPDKAYRNSKASFYDLNLHISHSLNAKNNLYVTGYLSHDRFNLNSDTAYQYGNKNANIKWKHIFHNKFYSVLTAGVDHYQYSVESSQNPVNAYRLSFGIRQTHFRADFTYAVSNKHTFNFGASTILYSLQPGSYEPVGHQSLVIPDFLQKERGLESALYFGDQYSISPKLSLNAGIRYSIYNYLGPKDVYSYVKGVPRNENSLSDTTYYAKGKFITTYRSPEYRLAARYTLSDKASLKASLNTLQQYIHMLSNTVTISPTDVWKLSDPHIKPQNGMQWSLGLYRNFKSNTIEGSVELYYKKLKHYLDYKSGAQLTMNHHIETDVI